MMLPLKLKSEHSLQPDLDFLGLCDLDGIGEQDSGAKQGPYDHICRLPSTWERGEAWWRARQ